MNGKQSLALGLLCALLMLRTACGSPSSGTGLTLTLTSAQTASNSDYALTGVVTGGSGAISLEYDLNGLGPQPISPGTGGVFSVTLSLAPGANTVTVAASTAGGQQASKSLTVTVAADSTPPISDLSASTMIAGRGTAIILSGSGFGPAPGTVLFGDEPAEVAAWTDGTITVTVPAAHEGGWTTVTVTTDTDRAEITDFFVGIEVTKPDLNAFLAEVAPPAGTALFLNGTVFELEQSNAPGTDYLPPYSYYGLPTDGAPLTSITATAANLLFSSSGLFPVRFQDLNLMGDAIMIRNEAALTVASDNPIDSSLTLDNVAASNLSNSSASFVIGEDPGLPAFANTDTDYLLIRNSTISGFLYTMIGAQMVEITDSSIDAGFDLQLSGHRWPLTITGSALGENVAGNGFIRLSSPDGISLSGSSIGNSMYVQFMNLSSLRPGHPAISVTDSTIGIADVPATIIVSFNAGKDSSVSNSALHLSQMTVRTYGGAFDFSNNLLRTDGSATFQLLADTGLNFSGNRVASVDGVRWYRGDNTIRDNEFTFSGSAADPAPLQFGSGNFGGGTGLPASFRFSDNTVTGGERLFAIGSENSIPLTAVIDNNLFDVALSAAGSVATLTGLTAPSHISASGNTWGELTDLDDVRALVTFVSSDSSVLVISE